MSKQWKMVAALFLLTLSGSVIGGDMAWAQGAKPLTAPVVTPNDVNLHVSLGSAGAAPATGSADAATADNSVEGRVEAFVKALTLYLARFVEAASALIIGIASLRALWGYVVDVVRGQAKAIPKEEIRLSLGRTLALALEFQLAADILKTAVAPTWQDVELLAAIAAIRTALNYFLEKELRNAETRDPAAGQAPTTGTPPPA